jgi:hypothetical protein
MSIICAVKSALDHARRSGARGLFRLATFILRRSIYLYEWRMVPPVVLRAALSAVRFLERSAALLAFGHRPHGDHKDPGRSHRP